MVARMKSPLRRKTNIRTNKKCFNTFSAFVQTLTYFSFLFRKFLRKQGIWWLTWLWHVVLSYTNKNILFSANFFVNCINSNLLYSIACIYVNCIYLSIHKMLTILIVTCTSISYLTVQLCQKSTWNSNCCLDDKIL